MPVKRAFRFRFTVTASTVIIGGRLCLFSFLICLDTVLIPSNYDLMVQNRTFFRSDLTRNWMAQFECVLPFMKRFIGYEG